MSEVDEIITFAVVIVACWIFYAWGRFDGAAKERQLLSNDVECMGKVKEMAKWIKSAEKFAGPDCVPSSSATYLWNDDKFHMTLSRAQFESECG